MGKESKSSRFRELSTIAETKLEIMPPRYQEEMTVEGVERVQIIVAEANLVVGSHAPGEMRGEGGSKLRVGERRESGLRVLDAGETAQVPLYAAAKIAGESKLAVIQQIFGGAVVAAGDARRLAVERNEFGVMIEAEIRESVGSANVGMVAANGFSQLAVEAPAAIGIEILAGVKAVGVSERSVVVMLRTGIAAADAGEICLHLADEDAAYVRAEGGYERFLIGFTVESQLKLERRTDGESGVEGAFDLAGNAGIGAAGDLRVGGDGVGRLRIEHERVVIRTEIASIGTKA